jgi:hypothetical protein
VVAQRQPVDRVIDLVVGLPVATAVAARRSIPLIRQASRLGVREVTRRARRPLGTSADTSIDAAIAVVAVQPAVPSRDIEALVADAPAAADAQRASAPLLPIDDYDHLAARQVVDRLATLTAGELAQIERYERAHRHRQTVLGRIAQLTS